MAATPSVLVALLGAFLLSVSNPGDRPVDAWRDEVVSRGAYVAVLADCIACHTAPGGAPMSGGLGLKTPMGTVYSTNITPDARTGIGRYSFAQFERAMRKGVAADGRNLYPAMPYPSYAAMTTADLRALHGYLTHGVPPVERANKAADMAWPFSMRWGIGLWNWAFARDAPFAPDPTRDAVWNRGAYLVEGPGHCGACHSPRGVAFQEKAVAARDRLYLAGETIESWHAPNLRGLWTVDDVVLMLKTGQNRFGTVSGSMVDVVHHSTQHFSDADLTAIATFLTSLEPRPGERASRVGRDAAPAEPQKLYATRGGLGYVQFCIGCHRADGSGVAGVFPALAANATVAAADPATLLHVALVGWKTAQTAAHPRISAMPAFSRLSDAEIAEILSFVRGSWGNGGARIDPSEVRKLRREVVTKSERVTGFRTPRIADMLREPNAEQLVRGMRLNLQTAALLPGHVGNKLSCTSCHLNAGTVADGSPYVGVAAFFPSYAPRAGRVISLEDRINGCFLRSMNGKALAADSVELKAMVAYFDWMRGAAQPGDKIVGRGLGAISMSIKPDLANGRNVYDANCAPCHGKEGQGLARADGATVYPPLWGDQSFNIGAGMARTYTAAAFVKRNMPVGAHERFPLGQGALSDQDAVDVAEYFSHETRPDFAAKVKDWPKDKKPADARY